MKCRLIFDTPNHCGEFAIDVEGNNSEIFTVIKAMQAYHFQFARAFIMPIVDWIRIDDFNNLK